MSLGFMPGYEPFDLDAIEATVTPFAETLASRIEDMVLPKRGSWLNESSGHLSIICGEVSALLFF